MDIEAMLALGESDAQRALTAESGWMKVYFAMCQQSWAQTAEICARLETIATVLMRSDGGYDV